MDNTGSRMACQITPDTGTIESMTTRTQLELAAAQMDTLPGIAERLGITPQALNKLEATHAAFPVPITAYGRARVYSIAEVAEFHLGVGRIYGKGRVLA